MSVHHANGILKVFGAGTGLLLAMTATYAACGGGTPTDVEFDCLRTARYATLAQIEAKQIILFADWLDGQGIVLTSAQQLQLDAAGNLVGEFSVDRPVKHLDDTVEMPVGWLPSLPADHPWTIAPAHDDDLFPAWFEVRVVDPLLYDPTIPQNVIWAGHYLLVTSADSGGEVILSLPPVDSGCR